MHEPINFKSPNNASKWQMGFNSAFKGLIQLMHSYTIKSSPGQEFRIHTQTDGIDRQPATYHTNNQRTLISGIGPGNYTKYGI
jgi:hypothetical protein